MSQLSLSVEVRAGDGARASGPLEELPAFLGSVVVETTRGIAVSGSRGRRGRAHQGVGDIPFWWLARLVGRLAISAKDVLPPLRCLSEGFVMLCAIERECGEKKDYQNPRPEMIVGAIPIPL